MKSPKIRCSNLDRYLPVSGWYAESYKCLAAQISSSVSLDSPDLYFSIVS